MKDRVEVRYEWGNSEVIIRYGEDYNGWAFDEESLNNVLKEFEEYYFEYEFMEGIPIIRTITYLIKKTRAKLVMDIEDAFD